MELYAPSFPPPPTHPPYYFWLALWATVVLFVSGVTLFLWVKRRHFYRTNEAGVEEFKNFRSAVLSSVLEGIAMLTGGACFMAGIVAGLLTLSFAISP